MSRAKMCQHVGAKPKHLFGIVQYVVAALGVGKRDEVDDVVRRRTALR